MLEDPDKDFSEFEDYRNFFAFEIHVQDIVSGRTTQWETRRGTGSGAEQQVPIYVAMRHCAAAGYNFRRLSLLLRQIVSALTAALHTVPA
ncbi:SbcC/MukB-like Walker B domain-containing protein [Bradyrhizobium sp. LA2.1]|uniref:SbcC/MukB-like Walker B domain-containing protein n=1 Tax=Bradyrhizobium sp. LA2.1 TaxID=3156376 RepID=UPI0033978651